MPVNDFQNLKDQFSTKTIGVELKTKRGGTHIRSAQDGDLLTNNDLRQQPIKTIGTSANEVKEARKERERISAGSRRNPKTLSSTS